MIVKKSNEKVHRCVALVCSVLNTVNQIDYIWAHEPDKEINQEANFVTSLFIVGCCFES